jgi:hypothetical protein
MQLLEKKRPKMQKSHLVGGFFDLLGGLDYKPGVP